MKQGSYIYADPTGNITLLAPMPEDSTLSLSDAASILMEREPDAEQIGFLSPGDADCDIAQPLYMLFAPVSIPQMYMYVFPALPIRSLSRSEQRMNRHMSISARLKCPLLSVWKTLTFLWLMACFPLQLFAFRALST